MVAELLFGLQQRTRQGVKTYDPVLRPICIDVRRQQVSTLTDYVVPAERGVQSPGRFGVLRHLRWERIALAVGALGVIAVAVIVVASH